MDIYLQFLLAAFIIGLFTMLICVCIAYGFSNHSQYKHEEIFKKVTHEEDNSNKGGC